MLQLDYYSAKAVSYKDKPLELNMVAIFDSVNGRGDVVSRRDQSFKITNDRLTLNGVTYQLPDFKQLDINTDAAELLEYFKARFEAIQPDMFLKAPSPAKDGFLPVAIASVNWEYPELSWRAIDKGGALAYFKLRPALDNAGHWVAMQDGVIARYGKQLCVDTDYKRSLQNINQHTS